MLFVFHDPRSTQIDAGYLNFAMQKETLMTGKRKPHPLKMRDA
jgi:hypothetical protein